MALGCLLCLALNHRLHLTQLLPQIKPYMYMYMYMYVHASEIVGRATSRESKWEGGRWEEGIEFVESKTFMYRYRMKEKRNGGL